MVVITDLITDLKALGHYAAVTALENRLKVMAKRIEYDRTLNIPESQGPLIMDDAGNVPENAWTKPLDPLTK
jgi:hypothetical protein